ncbi:MAG: hypothetical protein GX458_00955 [Phyllobacteriaceae bacterium]|nr:hypothetical protein [Phyllobacteriaceae bacterium]
MSSTTDGGGEDDPDRTTSDDALETQESSFSRTTGAMARGVVDKLGRLVPPSLDRRRRFLASKAVAEEAQMRGDFSAAYDLWNAVRKAWPRRVEGIRGMIECALERDTPERTEKLIESALATFPGSVRIIAAAARQAQKKAEWVECIELWERIIERRDTPEVWHVMYGQALMFAGRFTELDRHLEVWLPRFPESSGLAALRPLLAGAEERWDEAVAQWRDFHRRFPNDPVGWEHYGRALQELDFARLERGAESGVAELDMPAQIEVVDDETSRDLLMGFESIGSDCEFGLVQRRFGAEPLSLLRFNAVEFGGLMSAVAHRFEAMGERETTELVRQFNGEFLMRDRRWGLVMHTFAFEGQVDAEVLADKFRKRVAFLRDRFLADAAEGRKVLVFYSPGLDHDNLTMLHGALRVLGPVDLLHVRPSSGAEDPIASGTAVEVEPHLFVGVIGRSGRSETGAWDIAYDDWVAVCRHVRDTIAGRATAPAVEASTAP